MAKISRTLLSAWLLTLHVQLCTGRVEPLPSLPYDLQYYLDTCHGTGDLNDKPAELAFWGAMQMYVSKFCEENPSMTTSEKAFLQKTVTTSFAPISASGRGKRQATRPRLRKEIRTMTITERARYFNALTRLKRDTRLRPNIYDVLAGFHTGANMQRAHFGPAFTGWHRLYLWILESFLRLHDPEVTVPFWASVLDNEMEDPTESVIFSGAFFGPGIGLPTSGPFRGWQQINPATVFNRNVGGGQLYTYEGIDAILRRRRNSELLFPTAEADSNFEEQHGGPHIFVGGTMNDLNAAARDPIFFSHHSFVDQIWERFRYNQRAAGIPTETDYPWVPNDPRYNPAQSPTNITGFFPDGQLNLDYIQITGYSDAFFQLVQYEQVPTCPLCGGSQYLRCNPTTNRCMSRSIAEMRTANVDIDTLPGLEQAAPGRKKRLISYKENNVCHRKPFINDFSVNRLQLSTAISARQTHAMEYAYVPVKIVTKRPSNYKHFSIYSLYEKPMNGLGFKQELVNIGTNKPYRSCDKSLDSPGKIKIVAYGINHGAYSEEYVITDNRLAISESSGVIAVKMPTGLNPSEVMVAAFDSCGRVCRPYCKSDANMAHNSYFTGGVRISVTSPLIYGTSYGEALLNVWDIQTENMCPTMDYNKIPLTFFCEYTDNWIWGGSSRTGSGSGSTIGGKISVRALRTGRGRAGRIGVSNPRSPIRPSPLDFHNPFQIHG